MGNNSASVVQKVSRLPISNEGAEVMQTRVVPIAKTNDGYGVANPNLPPYGLEDPNKHKLIQKSFEKFGL